MSEYHSVNKMNIGAFYLCVEANYFYAFFSISILMSSLVMI